MIAAADRFAVDHARMQRHLPVRATILEREYRAGLRAHQHDRLPGKAHAMRLAALDLARPGQGIPVIGMDGDAAQVAQRGFGGAIAIVGTTI